VGLSEKLAGWWITRRLKAWKEAAVTGKLTGGAKAAWDALNGWKSVILTVLLTVQLWCKSATCPGPLDTIVGYADPIIKAIGWNPADAAVAPTAMLAAGLTIFTFGSAVSKAFREYRAGVPLRHLRSTPPEAIDASKLK